MVVDVQDGHLPCLCAELDQEIQPLWHHRVIDLAGRSGEWWNAYNIVYMYMYT